MSVDQTWTMPIYLTTLRDMLRALPALSEIEVYSAPVGNDNDERKVIVFIDVDTDETSAALGDNRREEVYIVEGVIQVLEEGSGDEAATIARDDAATMLAAVEKLINTTPDLGINAGSPGAESIRMSEITRKVLRQGLQDGNRRAVIEFDITVSTRIRPKGT